MGTFNRSGKSSPQLYTLGRGKVLFKEALGWRDLGNCTEFNVTIETEELEHQSTLSGIKSTDKAVALSRKTSLAITLDEISVQNLGLWFNATALDGSTGESGGMANANFVYQQENGDKYVPPNAGLDPGKYLTIDPNTGALLLAIQRSYWIDLEEPTGALASPSIGRYFGLDTAKTYGTTLTLDGAGSGTLLPGDIITGGTSGARGRVVKRVASATSATFLVETLIKVSTSPVFVSGELITATGPGTYDDLGSLTTGPVAANLDQVYVVYDPDDSASSITTLVENTSAVNGDYELDRGTGRLLLLDSWATVTPVDLVELGVYVFGATNNPKNLDAIKAFSRTADWSGPLKFVGENPANNNSVSEYEFAAVTLKAEGDLALIGDEFQTVTLSGSAEKDSNGVTMTHREEVA